MTLFLTSSPCWDDVPEGCDLPCVFDERNGFVGALREAVAPGARCAFVASDPSTYDRLEEFADTFARCFAWHGMPFSNVTLLDNRTAHQAERIIREADVLILAGGPVPTQNAFFNRIGLRALMEDFDGVVMGISAGTMNCADVVYAQPEMPSESVDPDYERFLPGLGLTNLNILPHYQKERDTILDGRRLYDDITYDDSHGHAFLVLVDGSFVFSENGQETLCGEAYVIRDGILYEVCHEGEDVPLDDLRDLLGGE